ncbi:MAG TPA: HAD family phosphatase [Methylomirabilota bacterium]|jgi:HAD superfamily hydrolase (TIGR01509 family)|nr:HAD family phosphatase [Methylomirabilota bacterium]
MNVGAVIFDLDGVLVDSEPLHLRATQAALGARGPSFSERDNRAFIGATDVEVLRVLRILFDLPDPTPALVEAKNRHLVALIRAEVRPLPGVPAVPKGLREAGWRLALASASSPSVIKAILERVGLEGEFEAVVSGDEVSRGKPAPDGFLMAARRLGAPPEQCLVVEDSRNGVLAGKAAGMRVAAVPGPATRHEDFSAADLVLPDLEALPAVLAPLGAASPGRRG